MTQSWTIFSRDLSRLAKTPKTWIILVGILIMPALYSWVNIAAFWDPYAATGDIRVAVVNQDRGVSTPQTGAVNVGEQVVEKLSDNHQIGWTFMEADQAQEALNRGEVYASITIPHEFSADLLSITSQEYHKPKLDYRVNMKRNAIAPIITDTASRELSNQIASAFQEQVALVLSDKLADGGKDVTAKLDDAQSSFTESAGKLASTLADNRAKLDQAKTKIDGAKSALANSKEGIDGVDAAIDHAREALGDVEELTAHAQGNLDTYTQVTTSAFVEATTSAAHATAQARAALATLDGILGKTDTHLSVVFEQANNAITAGGNVLDSLQSLAESEALPAHTHDQLRHSLESLGEAHQRNEKLLTDVNTLTTNSAKTADDVQKLADSVQDAANTTTTSAQTLRTTVSSAIPQLNANLGQLHNAAGSLASGLAAQHTTLEQARNLVDGLTQQLSATQSVLSSFEADLHALEDGVNSLRNDVRALNAASHSQTLQTLTGLDAKQIGDFFANPVEVTSIPVFPIGTYGNAMAALFTNLSLWIGAFMLMVIFRLEVDHEGVPGISVRQAYVGRLLLFIPIVVAQAVTVTVGNLLIGVEAASRIAYVGTAVVAGLAYLSIIYALSTALGHIGRGLAILIVILQIPGATGIYPIEMMPAFFRALSPVLPFSYGIDAMRETIGGYYGNHYRHDLIVLTLIGVAAFIVGITLRRLFAHAHVAINSQLQSTGLISAEPVQTRADGLRVVEVLRLVQGQRAFADSLPGRQRRLTRWIRLIAITGAAGLAALSVVATVSSGQKVLILGLWTAWAVIIFIAIASLEYVRQSLAGAQRLCTLSDDEVRQSAASRAQAAKETTVPLVNPTNDPPYPPAANKTQPTTEEEK